jgi:hypothetical protein
MKKIFLLLVAHALAYMVCAQGSLQLTAGANIRSSAGSFLVLDNMNVVNNGSFSQTAGDGFVKATGSLDASISGSGTTLIDKLLVAKTGSAVFNLQTNISVVSNVNFSGGLLNLNNSVLDLDGTGILTGESELSRAFTNGSGFIQATGIINTTLPVNIANLGAVITSPANLGTTMIRRGHAVQTGVFNSNNSIRRYFDIIPTNNLNLKATLRFYYFDAELNSIPEASLYQWKSKDNVNWDFVGADSRDVASNFVERNNISKFNRFTLATATAPIISCPADMTVSSNLKGCKASVVLTATATGTPTPTITYKVGTTVITSPFVFSKGTTTVTAVASNGVTPDASCSFNITVVCGSSSPAVTKAVDKSSEIIMDQLSVSAAPNPSGSYFILDIRSSDLHPVTIRIVDILGRELAAWPNLVSNSKLFVGHQYLPGVYFVKTIQGKQVVTLKLVKQAF